MQDTFDFLDPNSEMIALASASNTKNLLITALQIRGPVDENLVKVAVGKAMKDYPRIGSCLREIKTKWRHRLYWHPRPDLEFPFVVSTLNNHDASIPLLDAVLKHLAPVLDREWNLREELPGEMHLVRISESLNVAAIVMHHAAFDGASASEFGRSCVLHYKEMIEGIKTDSGHRDAYSLSTSRKRRVTVRKGKWENMLHSARLALMPFMSKPDMPAGSGMPRELAQYHVKRVLSVEETARVGMESLKNRGAFIDLLTASSSLAIERWNRTRNVDTNTVTTALTMNIRGRYQDSDEANSVSALFFESHPKDRKDSRNLVHSISIARINQLRRQLDHKHYTNTARMIESASLLPFNIRRKIVYRIVRKHQFSMAITLLGVVWPVMKNGRPTLDSYPSHAGDAHITEIHGIGYKLIGSTPLILTVYSYLNRLNFVMAASGWLFTRSEAEAFMDLFMETLNG